MWQCLQMFVVQLLNCNRGMFIVFLFQISGELTELSFMPANYRFLVIAFTSVALGTMATFGFARLKTRIGLITNRFIIVSSNWSFIAGKYTSSHIAVPITKGFIGKTRGSTVRGSCWNFVPTGMEGHPSHSSGSSLFYSIFLLSWNTIRHASASATPRLLDPYGWVLSSGIPTPYNPDRFGLKSLLTCTRTASWNTLS